MTVFGLGNPADRYADTRHNIGFMAVDAIAQRLQIRFKHVAARFLARTVLAGRTVTLVKPLLYMNESGIAIKEHLTEEPDEFLVICDDLTLPFGRLRLRPKGSDGGHKGLASIIYHLETTEFPRLRIGIDSPLPGKDMAEYVLEPFTPEQMELLPDVLKRATDAGMTVLVDGLQTAMNKFNPTEEENK